MMTGNAPARFEDTALLLSALNGRARISLDDEAKLRAAVAVHGLQGGLTARQAVTLLEAWERLSRTGAALTGGLSVTDRELLTKALGRLRDHAARATPPGLEPSPRPAPPPEQAAPLVEEPSLPAFSLAACNLAAWDLAALARALHEDLRLSGYVCGFDETREERVCILLGPSVESALPEAGLKLSARWRSVRIAGVDAKEVTLRALGNPPTAEDLAAKLTAALSAFKRVPDPSETRCIPERGEP